MGSSAQSVSRVKHRACDECRSRKLACSKEPGGCARCTKEGLVCHYSAQKPMGRPRKQHAFAAASASAAPTLPPSAISSAAVAGVCENDTLYPPPPPPPPAAAAQELPGVHVPVIDTGLDLNSAPPSLIDPSLGADMQMPDVTSADFLEFFGIFDSDVTSTQPLDVAQPAAENPTAHPPARQTWEPRSCRLGFEFDVDVDLNFDPHPPPPPAGIIGGGGNIAVSPLPAGIDAPAPAPDPASSPTAIGTTAVDVPLQPVTCSCLANLYLALDSIARLPTDIMPAMRVARSACKVAHDTIRCQICCPPPRELAARLAPTTFQNMMVVGALVPSIAEAYGRILALVDDAATRAAAAHARLPFSLSAYGGLSGTDPAAAPPSCHLGDGAGAGSGNGLGTGGVSPYENKTLDPAQWRVAVRALLRVDVYGLNCDPNPDGHGDRDGYGHGVSAGESGTGGTTTRHGLCFSRMGLRDLIAQMDQKSRSRHAEIDAMIDAGLLTPRGTGRLRPCHTRSLEEKGQIPHCRFIIDVAREAVESLVIA